MKREGEERKIRDGNYNWGWPHGNMVMRFGDGGTSGLTFAPGEAKQLTYSTSQSGQFHAHDMVEGLRPWTPPSSRDPNGHVGQERHIGTVTASPSDRLDTHTHTHTFIQALSVWFM